MQYAVNKQSLAEQEIPVVDQSNMALILQKVSQSECRTHIQIDTIMDDFQSSSPYTELQVDNEDGLNTAANRDVLQQVLFETGLHFSVSILTSKLN